MKTRMSILSTIVIILLSLWGPAGGALAGTPAAEPPSPAEMPAGAVVSGRISISAAAFRPREDGFLYENHGRYLKHLGGVASGFEWYYAPVYLPHGATVTKMTFYFVDNMPNAFDNISADLIRSSMAGGWGSMAYVDSSGSSGYSSKSDDTISFATVDNSQYTYLLKWDMIAPASATEYAWGCGVVIEYNYSVPLPQTSYLSLPPAAFQPFLDGNDYDNFVIHLEHIHSPGGGTDRGVYIAPVYLPHGATMQKMTFYHYVNSSYAPGGGSYLQRTEYGQGDFSTMAEVAVYTGVVNYTSAADDTIVNPVVDNSRYGYWVTWVLPATSVGHSDLWGCGVVIQYTNPPMSVRAGYISLPAAAFLPDTDGYDYENHARYLIQHNAPGATGKYLAAVPLPDGAVLNRMTFYYRSNMTQVASAELHRTNLAGGFEAMASVNTSGNWPSPWYASEADGTITNARVNNAGYGYHAVWKNIPDSVFNGDGSPQSILWGCGVVIEYGSHVYLPMIQRKH